MNKFIYISFFIFTLCSCGQSEINRLQDENEALQTQVDELNSEKDALEEHISELEIELEECQSNYSNAEDAIDNARNAIEDLRLQRLLDGDAYSSHGLIQDMDIDDIENSLDY